MTSDFPFVISQVLQSSILFNPHCLLKSGSEGQSVGLKLNIKAGSTFSNLPVSWKKLDIDSPFEEIGAFNRYQLGM